MFSVLDASTGLLRRLSSCHSQTHPQNATPDTGQPDFSGQQLHQPSLSDDYIYLSRNFPTTSTPFYVSSPVPSSQGGVYLTAIPNNSTAHSYENHALVVASSCT